MAKGRLVLVLGGARSGKSSFALREASALPGRKAYIATAQAFDPEMQEKIKKHRAERDSGWDTFEEPSDLSRLLAEISNTHDVVLIDCLTLWLSNLMLADKNVEKEMEAFISSLATVHCSVFTVSNEVGMGIVPANEIARRFRDFAGTLNQRVAAAADQVYLVIAGVPLKIKEG
jgi:adenosylcobinamide kinase/adenosylcobinamide-phosphate guanylyltransferase